MVNMKIKGNVKKLAFALPFVVVITAAFLFYSSFYSATVSNSNGSADSSLTERFSFLSSHQTSFCFGTDAVLSFADSKNLQGSCCGPMNLHRYQEQIEGLKKYSDIDKIPSDPYNISVSLAKELIGYDNTITLNADQQQTYNDAMKMSAEGGPCCCHCWRWYVYEGLAKYLIVQYKFTASQVAEVWNLSDGCGGGEHSPGLHA